MLAQSYAAAVIEGQLYLGLVTVQGSCSLRGYPVVVWLFEVPHPADSAGLVLVLALRLVWLLRVPAAFEPLLSASASWPSWQLPWQLLWPLLLPTALQQLLLCPPPTDAYHLLS